MNSCKKRERSRGPTCVFWCQFPNRATFHSIDPGVSFPLGFWKKHKIESIRLMVTHYCTCNPLNYSYLFICFFYLNWNALSMHRARRCSYASRTQMIKLWVRRLETRWMFWNTSRKLFLGTIKYPIYVAVLWLQRRWSAGDLRQVSNYDKESVL